MPFDGVTVAAVCRELNDELYEQRIDKVYQPEKNELVILIRGRRGNSRLLISAHPRWARMHTTETRKEIRLVPDLLHAVTQASGGGRIGGGTGGL